VFIFIKEGITGMMVLIVGGGPVSLVQLESELALQPDLVLAADRGAAYLQELAALPQTLIGDFDSLPQKTLAEMVTAGVEIKSFEVTKDFSDLELALDLAVAKGATRIDILGGLGGRIDHTLANIGLLLKPMEQGIETHLLDPAHDITVAKDFLEIEAKPGWAVSLIPLTTKVLGVTTTGLKYKLDNAVLWIQNTRGIHNEFVTNTASIRLTEGVLAVICFQDV
jgi:thiamine pyrophosphokinase